MKIETYYTAHELNQSILEIEGAIGQIENDKGMNSAAKPINIGIYSVAQLDKIKKCLLKHLNSELKSLKKQFENLK